MKPSLQDRLNNLILPAISILLFGLGAVVATVAVGSLGLAWSLILCLTIGAVVVALHDRYLDDGWGFAFSILIVPILIGMGLGVIGAGLWRAFS